MTASIGDPQGTQARALDTERKHPTHPEEPPPSYRRNQVLALALVISLPLLAYLVARWL